MRRYHRDAETDHSLDSPVEDGAAVFTAAFSFEIGVVVGRIRIAVLAATLDQNVPLEGILSGETLIAVGAWERFHGQMNSLMPLEIVISIETLRALVAFERTIGRGGGHTMRRRVTSIEMLRTGNMSAIETR